MANSQKPPDDRKLIVNYAGPSTAPPAGRGLALVSGFAARLLVLAVIAWLGFALLGRRVAPGTPALQHVIYVFLGAWALLWGGSVLALVAVVCGAVARRRARRQGASRLARRAAVAYWIGVFFLLIAWTSYGALVLWISAW